MTKLGFIGAGALAHAVGSVLAVAGHDSRYAGRDDPLEPVMTDADVVVLAVPFPALDDALGRLPPLGGRVLWSCVNALRADMSGLAVGFDTSAAERVASLAPTARVVAAIPPFATTLAAGSLVYEGGLRPTTFVCGDDAAAKAQVAALVTDLGAHAVDAGGLMAARLVEPAMMLLVRVAYADPAAPRDIGLRLLNRATPTPS